MSEQPPIMDKAERLNRRSGTLNAYGKKVRLILIVLVSVVMPLSLWGVASWTHQRELSALRSTLDARMNLYASNIVSELEKYEYLPVLLARDPVLRLLVEPEATSSDVDRANRHLSAIKETAQLSEVYVMSPQGLTIAASNWDDELSFVGRNFKFRPYFQNAMVGKTGHYFAMGTTSKIPGYYLSYPIRDGDIIKGVVVVKVSVARLEASWAHADETVMISDGNGVIIISSRLEWKFRTFEHLSEIKRRELQQSLQYLDAPLNAIQSARSSALDDYTVKMSIRFPVAQGEDRQEWEDIFRYSRPILGTDWTLHYIFEEATLQKTVFDHLMITCFVWFIAILIILYALQRRKYELRYRAMLEASAIELEQRVERRTKALQETNTQLENEIQERRKAEMELHHAQDELVQAGKLAALGQMAAGVTHEMNQPLTAIRSYSDNANVLLQRNRLDDVKSNLEQISLMCARLGNIFAQLKVFARKAPAERSSVSVKKVVADTLSLLFSTTKMEHYFIENQVEDLYVLGEAIRLEQVLLNILRNAVDAMEGDESPEIYISTLSDRHRVTIEIRDNGPGFDEEQLGQIFDPFFTTKEVGEGLGLGLSISSRIVQEFGGILRARNHPEGGAVFLIELQRTGENGKLSV